MAGGLIGYGTNLIDAYRQAGIYASQLSKGTKPRHPPVVQPISKTINVPRELPVRRTQADI